MSTYWDLHCFDCDESAGAHWNHGDEDLVKLWERAKDLSAIYRAMNNGLDVEVCFDRTEGPDLGFFDQHLNHRVNLRSEYGDVPDDCRETFPCEGCKCKKVCHRKKAHDGSHASERDYTPDRMTRA